MSPFLQREYVTPPWPFSQRRSRFARRPWAHVGPRPDASFDRLAGNLSRRMMKDMPASAEPMIRRNGSLGKAQPRLCREQLDRLSVDRDRVVVIDLCLISLTKDVPHVRVLRKRSPCRLRVFRGNAEEPSVLGDEGFVQILRRPFAVGDILKPKSATSLSWKVLLILSPLPLA